MLGFHRQSVLATKRHLNIRFLFGLEWECQQLSLVPRILSATVLSYRSFGSCSSWPSWILKTFQRHWDQESPISRFSLPRMWLHEPSILFLHVLSSSWSNHCFRMSSSHFRRSNFKYQVFSAIQILRTYYLVTILF